MIEAGHIVHGQSNTLVGQGLDQAGAYSIKLSIYLIGISGGSILFILADLGFDLQVYKYYLKFYYQKGNILLLPPTHSTLKSK